MSTYISGALVTVATEYTSDTGTPTDPTSVVLSVTINGATPFVYTYGVGTVIVRSSAGSYSAELDTTGRPGTWIYEWDGQGLVQAVSVSGFVVVESPAADGTQPSDPGVSSGITPAYVDFDGGSAASVYLSSQIIDGGNAASTYSSIQLIDGGSA